jgi:hypothetical protein
MISTITTSIIDLKLRVSLNILQLNLFRNVFRIRAIEIGYFITVISVIGEMI